MGLCAPLPPCHLHFVCSGPHTGARGASCLGCVMSRETEFSLETRGDVRRLIHKARTAAALLRSPGHRVSGRGEREVLASLLVALAMVAAKRLDPDYEPAPDAHHGGEDVVTDLFGEAA